MPMHRQPDAVSEEKEIAEPPLSASQSLPTLALHHLPMTLARRIDVILGRFADAGDDGYGELRVEMRKGRAKVLYVEQSFLLDEAS